MSVLLFAVFAFVFCWVASHFLDGCSMHDANRAIDDTSVSWGVALK